MQNSLGVKLEINEIAAENRKRKFKLITSEPPNFKEKNRFAKNPLNRLINSFFLKESAYFLSFAKSINFSAGESIYRHGDNIRFIYFPVTAVFSQFQVLEDGRTCEIAMIGSEGCVGLPGILAAGVSNCWTEVSVAGRALRISAEILQREFKNNSLMRAKIMEYLNCYTEQLSQKIICNYFHQVKERFCSLLLMLQDRCGGKQFFVHAGRNRPTARRSSSEFELRRQRTSAGKIDFVFTRQNRNP